MTDPGLREAYVDLYAIRRMTEARLKALLEQFDTPEAVLTAPSEALAEVAGMDDDLVRAVRGYERSPETDQRIERAVKLGVRTIDHREDGFPANLKELAQMPPVLFIRGGLTEEDRLAIAVVGSRRATAYGQGVAEMLGREFAAHGVTVVSGLARGIDTCAHTGALKAGGRTVAVLGCGSDVYYPPENRRLCDRIAEQGAIVTEFPPGVEPLAMNFPKRNRLISGLARGVVAVEARDRSGVLNTTAWAADQGRDVYTVPGRITDEASTGTNRLLRDGARPLLSARDVLEDLGVALRLEERTRVSVAEEEKPVLAVLSGDPLHVDEICQETGIPMSALLSVLVQLEIKGLVRPLPGKLYVRQV